MDISVYKRSNKPTRVAIPSKTFDKIAIEGVETPLCIAKETECHVTPIEVAKRMVAYAIEINNGTHGIWGDPQCGTGNILGAMIQAGCESIIGVERNQSLYEYTFKKKAAHCSVIHDCFLQFANCHDDYFDVIVKNPPFKKITSHMNSAIKTLKPNGCIVALVPTSYTHHLSIELETLPSDTFLTTKISTKIIAIQK
ncbi:class I SAM-dependent methyltransferase [Vibrio vulnificus]|uniref:class I SAM-dependent methyltransferase n=1 Tax=Vibrio vulnificus TaxID=672 RepID=UPI004058597B